MMFWKIFRFELAYCLKSKITWICLAILTAMVFRDMLGGKWDDLIASGRVARNSPYGIYYLSMYYSFWTATFGAGLSIQGILRDLQARSAGLVYSFPLSSKAYFWGKYAAAMVVLSLVASSLVIGFVLMPWLAPTLGLSAPGAFISTPWLHLLQAYLIWTLPGVLIFGSFFFALAAISGRAGPAYAAMAALLGIFITIGATFGQAESSLYPFVQIIDPLGKTTLEAQIYFWAADERMTRFLALEGGLLKNRGLYLGLAFGFLLWAAFRFDLRDYLAKAIKREARSDRTAEIEKIADMPQSHGIGTGVKPAGGAWHFLCFSLRSGWQEFVLTTREVHFRIAIGATMAMVFSTIWGSSLYEPAEGAMLPAAFEMLGRISSVSALLCLLAVSFYAAEIAGRERSVGIAGLVDACPVPSWSLMGSKLVGALLVALVFALLPLVSAAVVLLVEGFVEPNPVLYLKVVGLWLLPSTTIYALTALFAFAITRHKMAAQALAIMISITAYIFDELKTFEHPMALWSTPFRIALSDFDLGGQPLLRSMTLGAYWLSIFATLGIAVAYWLWPRGVDGPVMQRVRLAGSRLRAGSVLLAVFLLGTALVAGGYAYRSINIDNGYESAETRKAAEARYETEYGALRTQPRPRVVGGEVSIDLFPGESRADYTASLTLRNPHAVPIQELHLEPAESFEIGALESGGQKLRLIKDDVELRHVVYMLPEPLAAGGTMSLTLRGKLLYRGFSEDALNGTIFPGGSYIPPSIMPKIGYDRSRELVLRGDREALGLPGVRPSLPDHSADSGFSVGSDADRAVDGDRMTIVTRITTDADQLAFAPGEQILDEVKGDRRTFVYRSNPNQLWDTHAVSSQYAVRKGVWKQGGREVSIEILHNPRHPYNADRFLAAAKAGLDLGTRLWGAYPYKTLRIAEVPDTILASLLSHHSIMGHGTETIIMSSGNLIAVPEANGWINDYRKAPKTDWISYLVTREISRAWWGQSLRSANTPGAVLLNEGMPALSGMMAIEKTRGEKGVRRYADILSEAYLRIASREDVAELPISQADQRGYPYDRIYTTDRAAMAMHQVRKAIGDERLTNALKIYMSNTGGSPASVHGFVEALIAAAPTEFARDIVRGALLTTDLHDYRVDRVKLERKTSSDHRLALRIECTRLSTGTGLERRPMPIDGKIPVAVRGPDTREVRAMLDCRKGWADTVFDLSFEPHEIEVDPDRLRVDRNRSDNLRQVRAQ